MFPITKSRNKTLKQQTGWWMENINPFIASEFTTAISENVILCQGLILVHWILLIIKIYNSNRISKSCRLGFVVVVWFFIPVSGCSFMLQLRWQQLALSSVKRSEPIFSSWCLSTASAFLALWWNGLGSQADFLLGYLPELIAQRVREMECELRKGDRQAGHSGDY